VAAVDGVRELIVSTPAHLSSIKIYHS